jgi:4-alpha-glucanotransferase
MNRPGCPEGNWRWRCPPSALGEAVRDRLAELTWLYGRAGPVRMSSGE